MSKEMITKELAAVLDGLEFEEYGGVMLRSAARSDDSLRLCLLIRTGQEDEPEQSWAVRCRSVRKDSFCFEWADTLVEEPEHPLLWPYMTDIGSLFFSALDTDPPKLIGDIFVAQSKLTGKHFPIGRFLNKCIAPEKLCSSSSGLFAEGPLAILEAFRTVLEGHGAKCSITNICRPKRWTGSEFVPESKDLHVLVIGDSFVIAEGFEYERTQQ